MLPKTHIILGALFTVVLYLIFPLIPLYGLLLVFLSSFLIDFDHYLSAVKETHSLSLRKAFSYHTNQGRIASIDKKRGIRKKGDFHIFHTLEFILLVLILSFIWNPFIYIFTGMIFHSILDIIYLINNDLIYRREFFLSSYLKNKSRNKEI